MNNLSDYDLAKAMSEFRKASRLQNERLREIRASKIAKLENEQFGIRIQYHEYQKNLLGKSDSINAEGWSNLIKILNLKMTYNVGIDSIRIYRGSEMIKKISFAGNEYESRRYTKEKISINL